MAAFAGVLALQIQAINPNLGVLLEDVFSPSPFCFANFTLVVYAGETDYAHLYAAG